MILAVSCASSPPPKPPPPDDPLLANLTEWLKLDPSQQEKTRQLLKELDERNVAIRAQWEKRGKARPEDLFASRSIFQRDFLAILTEEQKRLYADAQRKMQIKGRRAPRPGS